MIKLKNKNTLTKLKKEIEKTKNEKYRTRVKTIIKLKESPHKSKKEIAEELMISNFSLFSWLKIYNEKGLNGLKIKKTGRPQGKNKWDKAFFEDLVKEINKSDKFWTLKLMQEWLKKEKEVEIPSQSIWYRITQLGYSHKSSRPFPYKGDREKQEEFKKMEYWTK